MPLRVRLSEGLGATDFGEREDVGRDWLAVKVKAIPGQALIGGACLTRGADTCQVPLGYNDLNASEVKPMYAQVSQRQDCRCCGTGSLSRLPNPVSEIAELVDGRKLIQAATADELII